MDKKIIFIKNQKVESTHFENVKIKLENATLFACTFEDCTFELLDHSTIDGGSQLNKVKISQCNFLPKS
jgi:hypothetical protein